MIRKILLPFGMSLLLAAAAVAQTPAPAPADVSGEWSVTFTPITGDSQDYDMGVRQTGSKIAGQLTSASGEFPFTGTVTGKDFTLTWTIPLGGRLQHITFDATVDGERFEGTAHLGDLGDAPLEGERTSH